MHNVCACEQTTLIPQYFAFSHVSLHILSSPVSSSSNELPNQLSSLYFSSSRQLQREARGCLPFSLPRRASEEQQERASELERAREIERGGEGERGSARESERVSERVSEPGCVI